MSEALERIESHRDLTAGLEYEESLRGAEEAVQAPLTCFTVQVFGESVFSYMQAVAMAERLKALMAETEENLNAGVMAGFRFVVKEWDDE